MSYSSYERQQLATYAAGHISADGTSSAGFGVGLSRLGTGVYAAVFGDGSGLVDGQSYTVVTPKYDTGASGLPAVSLSVEDTSNLVKTIFAKGFTANGTLSVQEVNVALEVAIYRTVEPGS